ncbi:MAG TPA: cobalt transporter CbiM [Kiritimatiellia bacterium]|nr:cobalt transporter CbiM [Kiritimatiellia bacterium]HMO99080.1 cobalt transporter CbiM [Kiritimatiellia bacterium]HMP96610.1 cobalt transporter CbiM [Kiritimatiellia bacterium]
MHLADGVISLPVWITGTSLAVGGIAIGLRRLTPEDIPKTALMTTALFIAALIHIPIGPTQWHLVLNGLAGLLLGSLIFPAMLIALALQAVMFGFGGLYTLGVNTAIMALPGWIAHSLLHRKLRGACTSGTQTFIYGAAAGMLGIGGATALMVAALRGSGEKYESVAVVIATANLPLLVMEALVTGAVIRFLARVKPEVFLMESDHASG